MAISQVDRIFSHPPGPVYVIAEIGVNHNGDPGLARDLIDVARACGADAAKFQMFRAESLATRDAEKADYQKRGSGDGEGQVQMLSRLELPAEAMAGLEAHCRRVGIDFLCTPFDRAAADFLGDLGMAAFKVGSGELTNLPFLAHLAGKGRPLLVSTGMADLGEIEAALKAIEAAARPAPPVALLHCVSNYPADPADSNLLAMGTMAAAFGRPVGWSDHTRGVTTSLAAVALGARLIEKHLTLDHRLEGPDHGASAEPAELRDLVAGVRTVEAALGDGRKRRRPGEEAMAGLVRRVMVAADDIAKGEVFSADRIALLRAGRGLPPAMMDLFLGRRARGPIPRHRPLDVAMID